MVNLPYQIVFGNEFWRESILVLNGTSTMTRATLVLLVFISIGNALTVIEPAELAGFYNSPWIPRYGYGHINTSAPIRARLVATFSDAAGPPEGNVILSCFVGRGTIEDQIRSQIGRGIVGFVNCAQFSRYPGILQRLRDGSDISNINIPVWDVSSKDFQKVINYMQSDSENITVIVELGFNDPNAWEEAFDSAAWPFASAFLGSYSLVVVALAAWKLSSFIRTFGLERSLPQVCLWIELICNLERAVYVGVDPWWSRTIFPLAAGHILYTISSPGIPATSLLITLYWKELLTNKKSKTVTFLDKAQIPFYVVVSFIWAFELTIAILRGVSVGPLSTLVTIISVFYGAVLLFTSIFFFYYGDRLLKTLTSTQSRVQTEKTKSKYKAVKLLFASAACQLGVVLFLVYQATEYAFYPVGLIIGNIIGVSLFISTGMFKVLAFSVPISKKSSSGGPGSRKPSSVTLPTTVSSARLRAGSATSVASPGITHSTLSPTDTHRSVELESPIRTDVNEVKSNEEVTINIPVANEDGPNSASDSNAASPRKSKSESDSHSSDNSDEESGID